MGNMPLVVFIDLESTHNVLEYHAVVRLGCKLEDISRMKVNVADGNTLGCTQICKGFRWKLQG